MFKLSLFIFYFQHKNDLKKNWSWLKNWVDFGRKWKMNY